MLAMSVYANIPNSKLNTQTKDKTKMLTQAQLYPEGDPTFENGQFAGWLGPGQNYQVPGGAWVDPPTSNTTTPTWSDPTGQGLSQDQYNSLVSGFNTQKASIQSSANDAANISNNQYRTGIDKYLLDTGRAQRQIDESGVQNELAKKQGFQTIMDMVTHGIQSGGVMLANRNASSSSATEALARAYGDIGRRQNNQVNNQYEQGNRKIGLAQEDLAGTRAFAKNSLTRSRDDSISRIALEARERLAQLDADMANASLPERINIEAERAAIETAVRNILTQHDAGFNQGDAAIAPTSVEARRAQAASLANAGTAATSPFDFSATPPAQFQGTGPFAAELPLFTQPRKKTA